MPSGTRRDNVELGKLVKSLREAKGLSQRGLAIQCGISNTDIMNIESGKSKYFKVDTLKNLAEALNIPASELLIVAGYLPENDPALYNRSTGNVEEATAYLTNRFPGFTDMLFDMTCWAPDGIDRVVEYAGLLAEKYRTYDTHPKADENMDKGENAKDS